MLRPKALDHVGLKVTDMDRTLHFYQRLGLTVLRTSGPNADGLRSAVIQVGGQELNIFSHPEFASPGKENDNPVGMDHFCLSVEAASVDDVIADLRQTGIDIVRGPVERRDGTALFVHDPDGVRVELQLKKLTLTTRTLSVSISASPEHVYEFAGNPANLPTWASGFVKSIADRDGQWVAETTIGEVTFTFAQRNAFGVLDHAVTMPSGESFFTPMRVVANGRGSEVLFTLSRRPPMTEAEFDRDARVVLGDLERLKAAVESLSPDRIRARTDRDPGCRESPGR